MDILKAEIERKKKLLAEKNLLEPSKKYFKRADLVKIEREEYISKYGLNEEEQNANSDSKAERKDEDDMINHSALSRKEVVRRLRERGEPILLFSETELEAYKRLHKSEVQEPEVNKGLRNDFQEAMEKVDQAYLDELVKLQNGDRSSGSGGGGDGDEGACGSLQGGGTSGKSTEDQHVTYNQIQEMAGNLGKGDTKSDMDIIMKFLELILRMWSDELNRRSATEKMATRGKMALATYTQTRIYLKPLLSKLRTKTLPEDIADSLTDIVKRLLDRNYIMASDAYLQMAIGNAPWPIGVTMVGIHARTGREKIFSKNVAHVLNDETQRKYIQALKRLMTKCQNYFPTNPSRCVEYSPLPQS